MFRQVLQHFIRAYLQVTFNFLAQKAKKNHFFGWVDFCQNRRIEKSTILTQFFRIEIVKKSGFEYLLKSTKIAHFEKNPKVSVRGAQLRELYNMNLWT